MSQIIMRKILRYFAASKTNVPSIQTKIEKPVIVNQQTGQTKDKYRKCKVDGPQLTIVRILMINGPLTSKEIFRFYTRQKEQKQQMGQQTINYFNSLSSLKKTLSFMRTNGKIKSNGYDRKRKQFRGWKVQQKRSLKYVHPKIIEQIRASSHRKDQLL